MKKIIFSTIGILGISLLFSGTVFAQDNHTAREEAEGKAVWEKIQAKELSCKDLSDDNFGALGEYFMGQMAGEQHEAMNNMMIQMMGEKGEEQMHIAMGKRMSGCEPEAPMPQKPRNNMMGSGMMGGYGWGSGSNIMGGYYGGYAWFGVITMILIWILLIVGIIAIIKWMGRK